MTSKALLTVSLLAALGLAIASCDATGNGGGAGGGSAGSEGGGGGGSGGGEEPDAGASDAGCSAACVRGAGPSLAAPCDCTGRCSTGELSVSCAPRIGGPGVECSCTKDGVTGSAKVFESLSVV